MADVTIYVSLVPGTTNLHLSDSEGHSGDGTITTDVQPGQSVEWVIDDSNITALTNIYAKTGSEDIFSSGPSQESGSTSWLGTVSSSATGEESYSIDYNTTSASGLTDDPKLKVQTGG